MNKMKKITLITNPEMLESIKEKLVNTGIMELSYFEHESYSSEGETVWWRGAVPMEKHDANKARLEIFLNESQLDKALRVLAHFIDNKKVKAYMSTVEALELRELIEA